MFGRRSFGSPMEWHFNFKFYSISNGFKSKQTNENKKVVQSHSCSGSRRNKKGKKAPINQFSCVPFFIRPFPTRPFIIQMLRIFGQKMSHQFNVQHLLVFTAKQVVTLAFTRLNATKLFIWKNNKKNFFTQKGDGTHTNFSTFNRVDELSRTERCVLVRSYRNQDCDDVHSVKKLFIYDSPVPQTQRNERPCSALRTQQPVLVCVCIRCGRA